uniref:Uncharacterized protein n=1 Tax=Tanacetum cinerariifolium TaxID=118510 RepID=A0A699GU72_TANCI|nr:hypothetical protein [Tanacetum cinerariifolium]GEW76821.1 hypothetical protein [Tanacetum cinerariifolium]
MKKLITELPSLTSPREKETLYAYLAISAEAVSVILLTDQKGRQCPVQYVSRTLNEAERNYAPMKKLALSLIHKTQRLRRYFEAHSVNVITDQPIKNILSNTETSKKLAKYAVELGAYNITLVSSPKGSGAGLVLIGPSGIKYTYALRLTFPSTNNKAEYEALLARLRIARQMNISNIDVKVDSKLVASQINKTYEANKDSMIKNMNQKVDVLSKIAFVAFNHLTKEVLVEILNEQSTENQEVYTIVEEEGNNWMTAIIQCLEEGTVLFKKGYLVPMLSLTYGSEAVIPAEIGIPTYRTLMIREGYNKEEMHLNLDLLQERRKAAAIREAKYKTKMEQYYNRKVRPTGFRPRDFVFRRNKASRVEDQGKLGPKWEGPYRVVEAYENGSYKLQTLEDKEIPQTWHAINLCKCYM